MPWLADSLLLVGFEFASNSFNQSLSRFARFSSFRANLTWKNIAYSLTLCLQCFLLISPFLQSISFIMLKKFFFLWLPSLSRFLDGRWNFFCCFCLINFGKSHTQQQLISRKEKKQRKSIKLTKFSTKSHRTKACWAEKESKQISKRMNDRNEPTGIQIDFNGI